MFIAKSYKEPRDYRVVFLYKKQPQNISVAVFIKSISIQMLSKANLFESSKRRLLLPNRLLCR